MYGKVTELVKCKRLYNWLLRRINGLKPLERRKMCQAVYSS